MLVFTDHRTHSAQNSTYDLLHALREHPLCARIDVVSRGIDLNDFFFQQLIPGTPFGTRITADFQYSPDGHAFRQNLRKIHLDDYDVLLLRLPHPIQDGFLDFLAALYPQRQTINSPYGIEKTGSKAFLLEVADLCPPMRLCSSIEDILAFKKRFPIVLKPLHAHGGKGIIRIDGDRAWMGLDEMPLKSLLEQLDAAPFEYLGMKYLKNVGEGDKRVVVINGQIIGAALRLPAKGSWLCNGAQGGSSIPVEPDKNEIRIAQRLSKVLSRFGVIFFGFDTLQDDTGRRVLSEINTLSIGGLPFLGQNSGPVVENAAAAIWNYVKNSIYGTSVTVDK